MSSDYDLDSGPDPAMVAAAEAEEPNPVSPIYAVGVGPGNPEYLTPRGRRAIEEADVVVGFSTVVEFIGNETDAELLTCGYEDETETLEAFAERVETGMDGTAVLMGDPNHSGYQFVGKVQEAVDRPVRVIPGISSIQIAASRARTPFENTEFVTLHKSGDVDVELGSLVQVVGDRNLLVLPRPYDWMPEDIAAHLIDSGAEPSLKALVLEKLTHEDESISKYDLVELARLSGGDSVEETPFSDLSVLAVRRQFR